MSITPQSITLLDGRNFYQALMEHKAWLENDYDSKRTRLELTDELYLSGVDLTGFNLASARFTTCNLDKATFGGDMLYDTVFIACDLTDSLFNYNTLSRVRFNTCTLTRTIFNRVNFDACSDYVSEKTATNFTNCDMSGYSILYRPGPLATDARLGLLANWTGTGVTVSFGTLNFGQMPPWRVVSSIPTDMT